MNYRGAKVNTTGYVSRAEVHRSWLQLQQLKLRGQTYFRGKGINIISQPSGDIINITGRELPKEEEKKKPEKVKETTWVKITVTCFAYDVLSGDEYTGNIAVCGLTGFESEDSYVALESKTPLAVFSTVSGKDAEDLTVGADAVQGLEEAPQTYQLSAGTESYNTTFSFLLNQLTSTGWRGDWDNSVEDTEWDDSTFDVTGGSVTYGPNFYLLPEEGEDYTPMVYYSEGFPCPYWCPDLYDVAPTLPSWDPSKWTPGTLLKIMTTTSSHSSCIPDFWEPCWAHAPKLSTPVAPNESDDIEKSKHYYTVNPDFDGRLCFWFHFYSVDTVAPFCGIDKVLDCEESEDYSYNEENALSHSRMLELRSFFTCLTTGGVDIYKKELPDVTEPGTYEDKVFYTRSNISSNSIKIFAYGVIPAFEPELESSVGTRICVMLNGDVIDDFPYDGEEINIIQCDVFEDPNQTIEWIDIGGGALFPVISEDPVYFYVLSFTFGGETKHYVYRKDVEGNVEDLSSGFNDSFTYLRIVKVPVYVEKEIP